MGVGVTFEGGGLGMVVIINLAWGWLVEWCGGDFSPRPPLSVSVYVNGLSTVCQRKTTIDRSEVVWWNRFVQARKVSATDQCHAETACTLFL